MAQHAHLDPAPFFLPGGDTGVLLVHGFTGSPPEMRPVGDFLNAAGLTVSGLCLPGHGTVIEDMNKVLWTDWANHLELAYLELLRRCRHAFVAGLSLGSLLTINFAAAHPELPGAILYSPATWVQSRLLPLTPLARYFVKVRPPTGGPSDLVDSEAEKAIWSYPGDPVPAAAQLYALQRRVRRVLPNLEPPLLIIYSTGDASIDPASAQRTYELAGSVDKQIIKLDQCGHVITVDRQWRFVAEQTLKWIKTHDH
jgi:carboxylesterase